jgi:hypothetical protein
VNLLRMALVVRIGVSAYRHRVPMLLSYPPLEP